jgi:drug/metabolite transporter (DMT)-like permease
MNDSGVTRRGFILFALLGVAWGIPYLLIKIAVGQLDPAMLVFTRMALAALILLPVAVIRGELAVVLRRWRPLLAFTVVEMVVPQFLLGSAEERLPSSTTGLLIAAVPLAGVGVAFLLGQPERLAPRNWLGIALGMAGVAALVGFAVSASDLGAFGEVLLVVIGYALGPAILAKWMPDLPGTGVMALGCALTAAAYAPVVAATGSWPSAWPSASVIVSAVLLAAVCSAGGFTLMAALVGEVGPVRTTTVTYLNPAVALIAGAVVLGESVTAWAVVGFALILAGCYLVATRRTGRPDRGTTARPESLPGRVEPESQPCVAAASGQGPATADSMP